MSVLSNSVGRWIHIAKNGIRLHSSTASSDARPVLYSYCHSSCSWRVRIALGLKKIPYEINAVSLRKTDAVHAYTNEYREVNPMQQVPALQIGEYCT